MRNKRLLALLGSICLILVLAALPFMAACPAPTEQVTTLKLGATLPMGSPYGYNAEKGYRILESDINKAGGIVVKGQRYNIEYISYDDDYTADKARAGTERLIHQDEIQAIVGMTGSGPTMAATPLAEAAKMILFSGCATSKFLESPYHYTFRTAEGPISAPSKFAYALQVYPESKTVAFSGPDTEGGHSDAEMYRTVAEKLGLKVIGVEFWPYPATDLTAVATKLASLNPDMVAFLASEGGEDVGLQAKALYQSGYRGHLIQLEILKEDVVKGIATDEELEGVTSRMMVDNTPYAGPLIKDFKQKWIDRYGEWPRLALSFYGCFFAYMAAVEKADSLDSDDVWEAMQGLEFETLEGRCLMVKRPDMGVDRFCDCAVPINFGHMENGEMVYDYTLTAEEVVAATIDFFGGEWR